VEVIIGRRVQTAKGNFTHGKNPRRLHIAATNAGVPIWVELIATQRKSIPKQELIGHLPSAAILIDPAGRNTLQSWLAARYRRSAFPDAFDECLTKMQLGDRIAKIVEPLGTHIVAIFFDVDEGLDREHTSADDPFTLSIDLLYSTQDDPTTAEAAARKAADAITSAFRNRCFDGKTNRWLGIELLDCSPISDEALTYSMSLRLKRWSADYISLRAEPPQPVMRD
jgi:hypothetical protein